MTLALERAALQFQSPSMTVDVALSGDTYTLRRDIGDTAYDHVTLLLWGWCGSKRRVPQAGNAP